MAWRVRGQLAREYQVFLAGHCSNRAVCRVSESTYRRPNEGRGLKVDSTGVADWLPST